jgi:hypothetical protein
MRPIVYKCPSWMFWLMIGGAMTPLAILPLVSALSWPPVTKLMIAGAECGLMIYALTLLPTKLVLSDEGLREKRLFSELRLAWNEIAEWRYINHWWYPHFWIQDSAGREHHLKRWLVFGKDRSRRVAEIMRERGIVGSEVCDDNR